MATLVLARAEATGDGGWLLHWTNAGHPPPLLVTHDGKATFLEDGRGLLLGTGLATDRPDATAVLPARSTLVLYTDGLIESPSLSLDRGLAGLRRHAAALAHRPLASFCDLLLERVRPDDNQDDVALLVLRTPAAEDGPPLG